MKLTNPFRAPDLSHIPGPRGLKFIAHMLHYQRDSLTALERSQREYGNFVSYPWPVSTVIIYDPKIIRTILFDKQQIYVKGVQTDQMRPVMGNGLATNSDRAGWIRNRAIVMKEMSAAALRSFAGVIEGLTEKELSGWKPGSVDLTYRMRKLTFEIVGRTLLGAQLSQKDSDEVDEAVLFTSALAHEHMFRLLPTPYWVPVRKNRQFKMHLANMDRIVFRLIEEAKISKANGKPPQSITERLVSSTHPETGESLDDRALRDEILTLLIAGYETTANSLIWILGLLSEKPVLQKEIADEYLGNPKIESMEFTRTHPFLYRAILEGIRLYTAIPMTSRKAQRDDLLGDYNVPQDTSIVIPAWVLHRHSDFWEEPLTFKPERFIGKDPNTMDHYIPFSKGGRRCVGEAFSLVEMAIILGKIVGRFQFSPEFSKLPAPVSHVSLKPASPVIVKTSLR